MKNYKKISKKIWKKFLKKTEIFFKKNLKKCCEIPVRNAEENVLSKDIRWQDHAGPGATHFLDRNFDRGLPDHLPQQQIHIGVFLADKHVHHVPGYGVTEDVRVAPVLRR